jgi:hypothetical protein
MRAGEEKVVGVYLLSTTPSVVLQYVLCCEKIDDTVGKQYRSCCLPDTCYRTELSTMKLSLYKDMQGFEKEMKLD